VLSGKNAIVTGGGRGIGRGITEKLLALAVDLGRDGIRCNAVAPGWIDSDLSDAYIGAQEDPSASRAALEKMHPVGRTGRPLDVGDAGSRARHDR
jgi:meso-butanediol dehydrogenase/(S,S)-butanediol dehydrogenase/diacetyl reductase